MLKIGLVGVGHFGRFHLNCLKSSDKFDLIGVFDIDQNKCKQLSAEYAIKSFANIEDIMKEVEVLDIVTPTSTHFEYSRRAIINHKHVFVEKPLAKSYAEAVELSKLLQEYPVKVQIGHIERFNPAYTAAKPYLFEPENVDAKRFGTYNNRNKDVSVIEDLMIHDIDILLQSVQSPVKNIKAEGKIIQSSLYDDVKASIEFENGTKATIHANRACEFSERTSLFLQHDSKVYIDYMNRTTEVTHLNGITNTDRASVNINGNQVIHPEIKEINAMLTELETFYHSIINNTTPPVSVLDSLKALKMCEQIKSSIKI